MHVPCRMGDELDTYVYNYDARGDNRCPLLEPTPVDESLHVFFWGGGRGYAAAAATSNWEFRRDLDIAFAKAGEKVGRRSPGSSGRPKRAKGGGSWKDVRGPKITPR